MPSNHHNSTAKSTLQPSAHPIPDGRFYTKANFFTLRNHSREGAISEQYQTDVDQRDQQVFEEMMQRRNNISKKGAVQAPAVPAELIHQMTSPHGYESHQDALMYSDLSAEKRVANS